MAGTAGGRNGQAGVSLMMTAISDRVSRAVFSTNAVVGFLYAADMGAHVSSNSWGFPSRDVFVERAIDYAAAKNVTFVFAAGNGTFLLLLLLLLLVCGSGGMTRDIYIYIYIRDPSPAAHRAGLCLLLV